MGLSSRVLRSVLPSECLTLDAATWPLCRLKPRTAPQPGLLGVVDARAARCKVEEVSCLAVTTLCMGCDMG